MTHDYRVFNFTLLTLAPVHIGSGDKYTSKEFIYEYDSKQKRYVYYFPDMGLFYQKMLQRGLTNQFEDFLLYKGKTARSNRLISFLEKYNITERNFGGYRITETGLEIQNDNRNSGSINEVTKFMRDPYGNPYIPGSSLKGALRTILMDTRWSEKNYIAHKGSKQIENKSVIPWGAKKNQPFEDIFNAIRVSDSQPLDNNQLILVQKWDFSPTKNEAKPLPLYREALSPLVRIQFTITTTTKEAGLLMDNPSRYAKEFYEGYHQFFLKMFPTNKVQLNILNPVYLGSGSGAWTKTVFQQADDILQKRYLRSRNKMKLKGVLKLTKAPVKKIKTSKGVISLLRNQESFYEMGKARFEIKEILE